MQPAMATDFLSPFGISAESGRPISDLSDEAIAAMLGKGAEPGLATLQEKSTVAEVSFAVIGDVDANDLSQSGWGVIFAPGVDQAIKDALSPLIEHRKASAMPFVIYDGPTSVRPGESTQQWLGRQGVRMDVVDPAKGVPFYLLIVGPPDAIPFEFQYFLDIYWAVGRLWFDTTDEFRQYAESVIGYETGSAVPTTRNVAMFATQHDFDNATQLFTRNVAKPLSTGEGTNPIPIGKRQKFGLKTMFGETATKAGLADLLCGHAEIGSPSLLFTGSHGMEFSVEDPRQPANQGAIVCQDWGGYGKITESHWFAAQDVPADAKVHGMMHVFFACYGGGTPDIDNLDRMNNQPRKIAPKAFFSALPSKLLSHPSGGALAVLAHIERAWAYSFQGDKGGSQTQGFRDVIGRLLRGERIGQATDVFNTRWAALSAQLAETHLDLKHGADIPLKTLGRMWVARDDARNFMILGDPAVRLRVEDLPPA
jgi:Peptidase family C25